MVLTKHRTGRVFILVLVLFSSAVVVPTGASKRTVRGVAKVTRRRRLAENLVENKGAEIKVRAEDKEEDKDDKEDKEDWETVAPTASPTFHPTDAPTTSAPTWRPSIQTTATPTALQDETARPTSSPSTTLPTQNPTVLTTVQEDRIPSSLPVTDVTLQPTDSPTATPILTDAPVSPVERGTLAPIEFDNSTLFDVDDNTTSAGDTFPERSPDPNGAQDAQSSTKSTSTGALVGITAALGTLACLGSVFAMSKRRRAKQNVHLGGDTMSEGDSVSMMASTKPAPVMSWSDVFHHSLAEEEKVEVAPACTSKSLFQETIIEESENTDADLEDDVDPSPIREQIVLQSEHLSDVQSSQAGLVDSNAADSYSATVANLLGCGATSNEDETKNELDIRSVTSEDMEYMYGTLPLDHLPETPRRSNVSPEGKQQGSQRKPPPFSLYTPSIYPATSLLGPDSDDDEEGHQYEPQWV